MDLRTKGCEEEGKFFELQLIERATIINIYLLGSKGGDHTYEIFCFLKLEKTLIQPGKNLYFGNWLALNQLEKQGPQSAGVYRWLDTDFDFDFDFIANLLVFVSSCISYDCHWD